MELEKMDIAGLRQMFIEWMPTDEQLDIFDELARRLALKDADLLLERDRAEKAEKELDELKIHFAEHEQNVLTIQMILEAKIQSKIKMLVEALILILPLAKGYAAEHSVGSNQIYVTEAETALAKVKGQ